jgi:tetratricopeptide (TPR) repeat protein
MKNMLRGIHLTFWSAVLACLLALGCAKSAEDLYKDGLVELEAGRIDIAQQRLEAAVEKDPSMTGAYKHLARIYEIQKMPDKVTETLEAWARQVPYRSEIRANLAQQYIRQGRMDEAAELYEELASSALNEKERKTYRRMLDGLKRSMDRREQAQGLTAQLAADPKNVTAALELGQLFFDSGQRLTISGQKNTGQEYLSRSMGLFEQVRAQSSRQLEQEPAAASAKINLASAYFGIAGHYLFTTEADKALEYLNKAREANPDEPKFYFVLSQLRSKEKDLDGAIEAVNRAIELAPDKALYLATLATYYQADGQMENSVETLRRADRITPDSGKYIFQIAVMKEKEDAPVAEIISLLEQAIEKEPENAQYRFSLAGFLGQEQKYEQSVAELQEVIRVGAGSRWENLARQMIEKTRKKMAAGSQQ